MRRTGAIGLAAAMLLGACSSLDSVLPTETAALRTTTDDSAPTTLTTGDGDPDDSTTATTEPGDGGSTPDVSEPTEPAEIPIYTGQLDVVIVETYPHDAGSYTEGLEFFNGSLIEASGLYGSSSRSQVDVGSGSAALTVDLQPEHWGSGLSVTGETGIQVTRHEQIAIMFDPETLREFGRFDIGSSAWGVCATEEVFFLSTGDNMLSLRDPMSFLELSAMAVTDNGAATNQLGELECVGDHVWATIWPTNTLVQINAEGIVTASVDLTSLVPEDDASPENMLGGVAYNDATGTFFVTGKRWGTTYEVTFNERG